MVLCRGTDRDTKKEVDFKSLRKTKFVALPDHNARRVLMTAGGDGHL